MKIYTSYFYQVRFFPVNLVPLSTAVWDPKWYHANKSQNVQFKDKRGVINGLRAEIFYPRAHGPNIDCRGPENCPYVKLTKPCPFILNYTAQLNELNFDDVMDRFHKLANNIKEDEGYDDVDFALLVHEAPTNKCSERVTIQRWFASHGVQVIEWSLSFI